MNLTPDGFFILFSLWTGLDGVGQRIPHQFIIIIFV